MKKSPVLNEEEKVLSLMPVVTYHARRLSHSLSVSRYSDLIAAGMYGALHAVRKYDGRAECSLHSFADKRIIGAMRDWMRSVDPLKREMRKQVNAGEQKFTQIELNDTSLGRRRGYVADYSTYMMLETLMSVLDVRERFIIECRLDGYKMWEIAAVLRVNESRVSHLNNRAEQKMRERAALTYTYCDVIV